MQCLASLIREHQFLARLVDALEAYSRQIHSGADTDLADLRRFAAAFTVYGDELHHEKEERILLPFLARHGFDWQAAPLPRVRREHRHERYLIAVLAQAGERLQAWTDEDRRQVSAAADALCAFQRQHHDTENNELFRVLALRLGAAELLQLERELEAFDEEPAHRERYETSSAAGQELIARYGASQP